MKKYFCIYAFLVICNYISAQPFTNIQTALAANSFLWADYTNDGRIDGIGYKQAANGPFPALYSNVSYQASFFHSDLNTSIFTGLKGGSVRWGDYDNDLDPDLLITGTNASNAKKALIYTNNNGIFSEAAIPLPGVSGGDAVWGDYDGDNDLDILLIGTLSNAYPSTAIYRNDDTAFVNINASLKNVATGKAAWTDLNNDNRLDIVIAGDNSTIIYLNSGNGSFTDISEKPFMRGTLGGTLICEDLDNDGYKDIVMVGQWYGDYRSFIYKNLGDSTFSTGINTLFPLANSSMAFADYDQDGDKDFLLSGKESIYAYRSLIYRNDGNLTFTEVDPGFEGLAYGSALWYDINDDGKLDALFFGNIITNEKKVVIYLNEGNDIFNIAYTDMPPMNTTFHDVSDYDQDGDMDIAITGIASNNSTITKIIGNKYITTDTTVIKFTGTFIDPRKLPDGGFCNGDLDNDNDLDLFFYGIDTAWRVYRNDGNGQFTSIRIPDLPFSFLVRISVANIQDLDQDGDQDILLGTDGYVLLNEGDFNFSFLQLNRGYNDYDDGNADWADMDKDGDLDLLITGRNGWGGDYYTSIYRNDGNFNFTRYNIPLWPEKTSVSWIDENNDGYLDAFLGSAKNWTEDHNTIFIASNNKDGMFTVKYFTTPPSQSDEKFHWADFDKDGDVDVLQNVSPEMSLYTRDSLFNHVDYKFEAAYSYPANWVDCDGDSDLDIIQGSYLASNPSISRIYRNNLFPPVSAPGPPAVLQSDTSGNNVSLSWSAVPPASGSLSFNVYVGSSPGTTNIFSPMADVLTGKRKVNRMGNVQLDTFLNLKHLAPGTYYWSVQSIDHSFMGSTFASEQSFQIPVLATKAFFSYKDVYQTVHFKDSSRNYPTSWYWDFDVINNPGMYTSTEQHPQFYYTIPGTYKVCLTVTNAAGTDTFCKSIAVKKAVYVPEPNFTYTANELTVFFEDSSLNQPTSWYWEFDYVNNPGIYTSQLQNPQFTYSKGGVYKVCMEASNSAGSEYICKSVMVTEPEVVPDANFNYTKNGTTITFQDASLNDPTTWDWNFGDGQISTNQHPIHEYSGPGTYIVCLEAGNSAGTDLACKAIEITIKPDADFNFVVSDNQVTFTDASLYNPSAWNWSFGDNSTSTEQNPVHVYNFSGNHTACLEASNSAGTDIVCKTVEIPVGIFSHNQQRISIYPNPVSKGMFFYFPASSSVRVTLLNLLGQEFIPDFTIEGSYVKVNTKKLNGNYIVRVQDKDHVYYGQINVD